MLLAGVRVVLVSPPHQFKRLGPIEDYNAVIERMAKIYRNTSFVDIRHMREVECFEEAQPLCHFSQKGARRVARAVFNHLRAA